MVTTKVFKSLGVIFVLAALFFVFQKLWFNKDFIFVQVFTPQISFIFILGAGGYALINIILVVAWFQILNLYGQVTISFRDCFYIYARSQIAKYLPGNIFHIAGRHALGYRFGIDHRSLIGTTLYEIVGMLTASGAFAVLGIALFNFTHQHVLLIKIIGICLLMFFFLVIVNKMISRFEPLNKLNIFPRQSFVIPINLFSIYSLYFIFFFVTGFLFFYVIYTVTDISNFSKFSEILTIFSLSWIVGFLTPGAPGGLGVREAILVGSLSTFIGEPNSVFVALLFRLITLCGDVLFFLSSFFLNHTFCQLRL